MEIYLTNTLTRKKERFEPIKPKEARIYSCGPTVYNYAHIGNLRAFLFADTLRRMFMFNGYKVTQVMNITDVGHLTSDADEGEDKLEKGAKREGKSVWDVAKFYTDEFLSDMHALNILKPTYLPKATDHIKDMIEVIRKLEKAGYTYLSNGNVYFDTSKFKDYGKMAKIRLDDKASKPRVEKDPDKKHPFDFVLWFTRYKYANHEMQWDSPWGKGFPGWHIECSAMSTKYLGEHFDIHTGGIDHIPVHHTNEIAQSECAFGHKWVNYWMHSDFLVMGDKEKMAKSGENFLRLKTLTDKGYSPLDYRYYCLLTQYRKPMTFTWEALDAAKNAVAKLKNKVIDLKRDAKGKTDKEQCESYRKRFNEALNDDLNTPVALSVLWEMMDSDASNATKLSLIKEFDEALGLDLDKAELQKISSDVKEIQKLRDEARKEKDWKRSDELRDKILALGYQVFDSKDGSELRKIK